MQTSPSWPGSTHPSPVQQSRGKHGMDLAHEALVTCPAALRCADGSTQHRRVWSAATYLSGARAERRILENALDDGAFQIVHRGRPSTMSGDDVEQRPRAMA